MHIHLHLLHYHCHSRWWIEWIDDELNDSCALTSIHLHLSPHSLSSIHRCMYLHVCTHMHVYSPLSVHVDDDEFTQYLWICVWMHVLTVVESIVASQNSHSPPRTSKLSKLKTITRWKIINKLSFHFSIYPCCFHHSSPSPHRPPPFLSSFLSSFPEAARMFTEAVLRPVARIRPWPSPSPPVSVRQEWMKMSE